MRSKYGMETLLVSPVTNNMWSKPLFLIAVTSLWTCASFKVSRLMALLMENPQYVHSLAQVLDKYRGANRLIVLPKRCLVSCSLLVTMSSKYGSAAGEINAAKSSTVSLLLPNAASTSCSVFVWCERVT